MKAFKLLSVVSCRLPGKCILFPNSRISIPTAIGTNYLLVLGSCFLFLFTNAQSGSWIWMNGSDTANSTGTYGILGTPSVNNSPPALYQAVQWTDKQGNFWIFGGLDIAFNVYSDLWEYSPYNNTWTWVKGSGTYNQPGLYGIEGVPSVNNMPGPQSWGCASWTDSAGDLWFFGGQGFDSLFHQGNMNDLWRYHIATNEWTWMSGPSTVNQPGVYGNLLQASDSGLPPVRKEVNTAWIDKSDNLWLFGGINTADLNDIWRYSIAGNQWAWMGGSQLPDAPADYGAQGLENVTNVPNGRCSYTHWTNGNYLYFAGGVSFDKADVYNDVWRFNLNNNYWTWVGGDSGNVSNGQYINFCSSSSGNKPGGRFEQRSVQLQLNGCTPALFMWGGATTINYFPVLNDLWSFDLGTGKWIWVSGTDSFNSSGNFGVQGVSDARNMPPAGYGACLWSDNDGRLWLWGGSGYTGQTNAIWEYIPDSACYPAETSGTIIISSNKTIMCAGDTALICAPAGFESYNWNTGDTTVCISAINAGDYYVIVKASDSCGAFSNHINISTYQISAVSTNQDGDTLKGFGERAYQWLLNDTVITGGTDSVYIASMPGNYILQVTDSNGCKETSTPIVINGISNEPSANNIMVFPNPTSTGWQLNVSAEWEGSTAEVFDATGRSVFKATIASQHSIIEITGIANGVYELRLSQPGTASNAQKSMGYNMVRKLVKM